MKQSFAILSSLSLGLLTGAAEDKTDRRPLIEIAQLAGIDEALVVDKDRQGELIEALRRRILQGYVDEQAFSSNRWRAGLTEQEIVKVHEGYYCTRATAFENALKIASKCQCIELVPLLVKLGDMNVLGDRDRHYMDTTPRSVRAIVEMGPDVIEPLFDIIDRSSRAKERYYALAALGAWRGWSGNEKLAKRMEERCDTSKLQVKLALAFLRGEITSAEYAVGQDGKQ